MNGISLCTGYGGLDLGVEMALGPVRWLAIAETEKWAALVAEKRIGVPNLGDIKRINWKGLDLGTVDVLTAGYPCQPFSQAGRRLGEEDPRHLWPHVHRAIRHLRPGLVVLENVPGHRSKGFGRVLGDLAEARYDCRWTSLRASDVGAPHRRERVFIVAAAADPHGPGPQGRGPLPERADRRSAGAHSVGVGWGRWAPAVRRWERELGRAAPHPVTEDGRLHPRFVEWMMGLPDGWVTDVVPRSSHALKILGNGVVPQQAAAAIAAMVG